MGNVYTEWPPGQWIAPVICSLENKKIQNYIIRLSYKTSCALLTSGNDNEAITLTESSADFQNITNDPCN